MVAIAFGSEIVSGKPAEVRRDDALIEAYLGQSATADESSVAVSAEVQD